ncbi:MFS transporter [Brevibacterium sp. W7.2]|uniref:MFS transporter n=1 Tax=Brevibacterium sp. W7.2 TaxID=2823518 RepID=UPI001BA86ACC|nr:MFS transporter [Brevibacterium sp. W7.2]
MTTTLHSTPTTTSTRHGLGFWLVAAAFLIGMAYSTLPTPLYPLYAERDGFSTFVVTIVFSVYAVGVVISLILVGHISDWVGRKRIIIPALALEAASAVIFLLWPDLPGLIAARFISGLGIGMLTATATAHLHELHSRHRPHATDSARSEVVSIAANIGGLGLGPLIAGFLAQYVTGPLVVPYLVFLVLLIASIVAVALAPETVDVQPSRPSYRPQLPGGARAGGGFWQAAVAALAAFSVFGVFTSVTPEFLAEALHEPSRLIAGAVTFVVFAAAALAQTATQRMAPPVRLRVGVLAEILGFGFLVAGTVSASLVLFLVGGAVAGAGAGFLFKGAVGTILATTSADRRGAALAGLFLVAYLGLIVPVVGLGLAVTVLPSTTAMIGLSAILVIVLAGLGLSTVLGAGRSGTVRG